MPRFHTSILASLLLVCALAAPLAVAQTYRSNACSVTLKVPKGWTLEHYENQRPPDHLCDGFRLLPKASLEEIKRKGDYQVYALDISIVGMKLERSAQEAGFTKEEGRWVLPSSLTSDKTRAHPISGHGWRGIKVQSSDRCYNNDGYEGLCDLFVAVVNDGHERSVILTGGSQTDDVFDNVVSSIRFQPKK